MTWEELCQKAKEIGYKEDNYPSSEHLAIWFTLSGVEVCLVFWKKTGDVCVGNERSITISENRTPEQMWKIMENLK